jgi:ABC-type transport system involved in multi-copper enzyme maturation permease subunit
VIAIVRYALRESLRRRVFAVVVVLTVAFLALYAVGAHFAFKEANDFAAPRAVDPVAFTGATIFGLAMFATLFLGAVLAVFLTLGVVRGDAETGLLQPLVVRPLGRAALLTARFAGAAAISFIYVVIVFSLALGITLVAGDWRPDHVAGPGVALGLAVVIIAALSLFASVYLSGTAQGIAVLMVFGAGLTAGLLGQIGDALNSGTLESVAHYSSWVLPFEALYQAGLHALISETGGLTNAILRLGPFGGAEAAGGGLGLYAVAYCAGAVTLAAVAFSRRDL